MQFNSYEFILIFMPLLFAGYFILNRFSHGIGKLFLICGKKDAVCCRNGIRSADADGADAADACRRCDCGNGLR